MSWVGGIWKCQQNHKLNLYPQNEIADEGTHVHARDHIAHEHQSIVQQFI